MAKEENGKWITVKGTHVFIPDGKRPSEVLKSKFKLQGTSTEKYNSNINKAEKSFNARAKANKTIYKDAKTRTMANQKNLHDYRVRENDIQEKYKEGLVGYESKGLQNALPQRTAPKGELSGMEATNALNKLEAGMPVMVKYGKDFEPKQAIYLGRNDDGRFAFYDGGGVTGRFDFGEQWLKDNPNVSFNFEDNDPVEWNRLNQELLGNKSNKPNWNKDTEDYMNIPQEERVKAYEEGIGWKDLVNIKNLEKSIIEDQKNGTTMERMKKIADQERYDRLADRYKEQGYNEEEISKLLGERPKTGISPEELNEKYNKSTTLQEISDEMSYAETYEDLYNASSKIEDPALKKEVERAIDTCENDGDSVEEAYSIVTSDLIDSRIEEESDLDKVKRIQKELASRGSKLTKEERAWKEELAETQKKLEGGMSREERIKELNEKAEKEIEAEYAKDKGITKAVNDPNFKNNLIERYKNDAEFRDLIDTLTGGPQKGSELERAINEDEYKRKAFATEHQDELEKEYESKYGGDYSHWEEFTKEKMNSTPINKAKESAEKYKAENYEKKKQEMNNWLEKTKGIKGKDDTFEKAKPRRATKVEAESLFHKGGTKLKGDIQKEYGLKDVRNEFAVYQFMRGEQTIADLKDQLNLGGESKKTIDSIIQKRKDLRTKMNSRLSKKKK